MSPEEKSGLIHAVIPPDTSRRVRLVPRVLKPRRADYERRIAKSLPVGPMTKSAPGCSGVPVIDPATGEALTWERHRKNQMLKKSDPSGKHAALSVGQVIHFESQGQIIHAKTRRWGSSGVTAIERDGTEVEIPWPLVRVGQHPEATVGFNHEDEPIRQVQYSIDDIAIGQFVSWWGQGNEQTGQVVGLGRVVTVERAGERLQIRYDEITEATWERQ